MLCSVSTLRLSATLIHTIRQILVALRTTLRQRQRVCTSIANGDRILVDCFDHVNLQPTFFREDVDGVGGTSQA